MACLCTLSACSLLFDASSADGGLPGDQADAEGSPDATEDTIDAAVDLLTPRVVDSWGGTASSEASYTLSGPSSSGASDERLVIFVINEGSQPMSVSLIGSASVSQQIVSSSADGVPSIFVYVVEALPPASFDIAVEFASPATSTVAAVLVEGAGAYRNAELVPGTRGSPAPTTTDPVDDRKLMVYSVACSGAVGWQSTPRRLWIRGVGELFSSTGLRTLMGEGLDVDLSADYECGGSTGITNAAAGVIFTSAFP